MERTFSEKPRTAQAPLDWFQIFLRLLYAFSLGFYLFLLTKGFSFYRLPLPERPHHDLYWLLKPGGKIGHTYGIIGSAMMILMHLYSLRKRGILRWGKLSHWLNIHIYFGIMGPLFIILHTSFKVQGLVALSFWSMIAVVLSGILGRYLYLQIPRTLGGDPLTLQQVQEMEKRLTQRLKERLNLEGKILEELDRIAVGNIDPEKGSLRALFSLFLDDLVRRRRRMARFRQELALLRMPPDQEALRLIQEKITLRRKIVLWTQIHDLFHYWHVFHKPFAAVMYLFMVIHIIVALWMGYIPGRW